MSSPEPLQDYTTAVIVSISGFIVGAVFGHLTGGFVGWRRRCWTSYCVLIGVALIVTITIQDFGVLKSLWLGAPFSYSGIWVLSTLAIVYCTFKTIRWAWKG